MTQRKLGALIAAAAVSVGLLVAAAASSAQSNVVPSWCGPKKITLGLTDGFGGNSWRLVTTAAGKDEAAKCPSVTEVLYADGQGDTQKSISDIQGMVAKGVDALVVFPDAGEAMLPALRSAFQAGVVTVPYRVDPGGDVVARDHVLRRDRQRDRAQRHAHHPVDPGDEHDQAGPALAGEAAEPEHHAALDLAHHPRTDPPRCQHPDRDDGEDQKQNLHHDLLTRCAHAPSSVRRDSGSREGTAHATAGVATGSSSIST